MGERRPLVRAVRTPTLGTWSCRLRAPQTAAPHQNSQLNQNPTLTPGHPEGLSHGSPWQAGKDWLISDTGQVLTSVKPEGGRMRWREAFGSLGLSSGSRSPQAVDLNLITDIFTCDNDQHTLTIKEVVHSLSRV